MIIDMLIKWVLRQVKSLKCIDRVIIFIFAKMSDLGSVKEDSPQKQKRVNDKVKHLKNWDQVEKLYIELDSPTFKKACENLGVEPKECKRKR